MSEKTEAETQPQPVETPPARLPARFWVAIDHGLMTREQAEIEWAKQHAAGAEPDATAWDLRPIDPGRVHRMLKEEN